MNRERNGEPSRVAIREADQGSKSWRISLEKGKSAVHASSMSAIPEDPVIDLSNLSIRDSGSRTRRNVIARRHRSSRAH